MVFTLSWKMKGCPSVWKNYVSLHREMQRGSTSKATFNYYLNHKGLIQQEAPHVWFDFFILLLFLKCRMPWLMQLKRTCGSSGNKINSWNCALTISKIGKAAGNKRTGIRAPCYHTIVYCVQIIQEQPSQSL